MAMNLWRGDAVAVAQIDTITPASVAVGNTFSIAINGKTVSYTTAAGTVADVCTGLTALLAASATAEFQEIAWTTDGVTSITATAVSPGVPFAQVSSASGGTAMLSTTHTMASAGPKDWSTPANWSTGSAPAAGDDVVFTNSANPCLYGLAQSSVGLDSLTVDQSFTGTIGNPRNSTSGYLEYRPTYLSVGAATVTIGGGPGAGSGRIKIDTGSGQSTMNVVSSGSPAENNVKSILWKGTHAANVVNISKGSFAAAYLPGESATIATLNQGFQTNQAGDTDVLLGAGCTLSTINKTGGSLTVNSNVATLKQGPGGAGTTVLAAGTPTTIKITGGTVIYRTAGTYASLVVEEKGTVDFSQDPRPKTGTSTTLGAGATLLDPGQAVTFTAPIALECALADVTIDLGANFNLQRS
jgi:trimeric autotransporter adhesin